MSAVPVYSSVLAVSSSNQANAIVSRDASGNSALHNLTVNELIATIMNLNVVTKTTAYVVLGTEGFFFLGDATGGAFNFTLPAASGVANLALLFTKKDSSGNAVTLVTVGENIIVTGSATTSYALAARGNSVFIISDGTNWYGMKS
jgi:hypothetical protein